MASMIFTVPDEKWPTFKEAFLEYQNVPIDPDTGEPTMTENEWVREWGRLMYVNAVRQGLKRRRDKAHPVTTDADMVT